MNRADIKARILSGINDDADASVLFTDAQLNDLIDEAAEFIVGETRAVRRTAFVSQRSGAQFYSLQSVAPDLMYPYRIWNDAQQQRLSVTSMDELDKFQQRWANTTEQPEMWFPVSWDLIGIWPRSSASGGRLRVDYFAWPKAYSDDEDTNELSIGSVDALTLYGQYLGLLKGWDAERAALTFAQLQTQEVLSKARSGIHRIKHRSFQRSSLELPHSIRTED